jgi:hypothetical protein
MDSRCSKIKKGSTDTSLKLQKTIQMIIQVVVRKFSECRTRGSHSGFYEVPSEHFIVGKEDKKLTSDYTYMLCYLNYKYPTFVTS